MFELVLLAASLLAAVPALAQTAGSLPERDDGIGYATPQDALLALRAKPGVIMSQANGWLLADDRAEHVLWAFPPSTDAAFPAVVRRQFVATGNQLSIKMGVKCGGTKLGCDQMVLGFEQLNERTREQLSHQPGAVPPSRR